MTIISAAPTSRLTRAVAENDNRLKRESSMIGNTFAFLDPPWLLFSSTREASILRSKYTSIAMNVASNASEAPINQGLFCMGAWLELEPDTAIDDVAAS